MTADADDAAPRDEDVPDDPDAADDDAPPPCPRCGPDTAPAPPLPPALAAALGPPLPPLPAPLADAIARAARCLATAPPPLAPGAAAPPLAPGAAAPIHRAHVELVHERLGPIAEPLAPWLAARARAARPDLAAGAAAGALLVSDADAVLIHPAEIARERLDALLGVDAPRVLVASARAALADAEARAADTRLEWERVHAWPAPGRYPGTVGFAELARTLAEHALPPLVAPHELGEILAAIAWVAPRLVLDDDGLEYRHHLAALAAAATAGDPRRARGLRLAVRFLDELGRTDLRESPEPLLDDCYLALRHHASAELAARLHRTWLELAVPRAWARIAADRAGPAPG